MALEKFNQALEAYKEDLGYNQFWRYKSGRIPKVLKWLAERPDLAIALAEDARKLEAMRIVPQQDAV